jgi:GNAT superfamily N-acetyltransferase
MFLAQIHPSDGLARQAVLEVLNRNHDKRIRQSCLDFWRRDYKTFTTNKNGGDAIFIVAMDDSGIVGISCAAILRRSRRCFNSMTVVSRKHRKKGIGKKLLKAKLKLLKSRYPKAFLVTGVSDSNKPGLKICSAANLEVVSEGQKEREGKEPTKYYVLSNNPGIVRTKQ